MVGRRATAVLYEEGENGLSEARFQAIRARFDAIKQSLPLDPSDWSFEISRWPVGDGTPHIEIEGLLQFVVSERGYEYERRIAADEDELLYWLITAITGPVAVRWEAHHRIPGDDPRRRWFAKEIEMLQAVNPRWAERRAREHERSLKGLSKEPPR
jgi:hypothetical protein